MKPFRVLYVYVDDNDEVYAALRKYPSAPKNIIISEGLSSVIYESKNAELNIIEFPDQVHFIFFLYKK